MTTLACGVLGADFATRIDVHLQVVAMLIGCPLFRASIGKTILAWPNLIAQVNLEDPERSLSIILLWGIFLERGIILMAARWTTNRTP
jgi:hypothetical protein